MIIRIQLKPTVSMKRTRPETGDTHTQRQTHQPAHTNTVSDDDPVYRSQSLQQEAEHGRGSREPLEQLEEQEEQEEVLLTEQREILHRITMKAEVRPFLIFLLNTVI